MPIDTHTDGMHPIASIQAVDVVRRAVRGAGPAPTRTRTRPPRAR